MSIQTRILKRVQQSLPEMRLCKDVLVLAPTEHILRGFAFERTIEKGRYYFWRVVMPLYNPTDFIYLNYSDKIPIGGEIFWLSPETVDQVADEVLNIVEDGHLSYLRNILHPKDFLGVKTGHSSFSSSMDRALTHYMLGDVGQCIKLLEEALAANLYPDYPDAKEAAALLKDLRANPADAARRVEGWERANIERFGLADAMIGTE